MKILSADEAVKHIGDRDRVAVCGIVSLVTANDVIKALGDRFESEGHPKNLTLISPNRTGITSPESFGFDFLAQPGLVEVLITSTFNAKDSPEWTAMAERGDYVAYCYPMGVLLRWIRECAAGSPGLVTAVGLNTYADPLRFPKGVNVADDAPSQDLVRSIEIDGDRMLFYRSLKVDVAVIRGTVADEAGNISMDDEPVDGGMLHLAMAAKNSGGIVIAQVKRTSVAGSIHPRMVRVPGFLVDFVVVCPDSIQSQDLFEPAFTGQERKSPLELESLPLSYKKVIARRAVLELRAGDVINLGVGTGSDVPRIVNEEGRLSDFIFSVEHGALGGLPASGGPGKTGAFGAHYNPEAIIDAAEVFDLYQGGGLDVTVLGFAQVDREGSVNVGLIGGRARGPGGFVDITHATKTILFCGALTAGSLDVGIVGGDVPQVQLKREGHTQKFVQAVDQVSFHGPTAIKKGQVVRYITERCVFDLTPNGLLLTEIAPGVEVDSIRGAVGCDFAVSSELREMPECIFSNETMGWAPRKSKGAERSNNECQ